MSVEQVSLVVVVARVRPTIARKSWWLQPDPLDPGPSPPPVEFEEFFRTLDA
jgi:hypothetical protein